MRITQLRGLDGLTGWRVGGELLAEGLEQAQHLNNPSAQGRPVSVV